MVRVPASEDFRGQLGRAGGKAAARKRKLPSRFPAVSRVMGPEAEMVPGEAPPPGPGSPPEGETAATRKQRAWARRKVGRWRAPRPVPL